MAPMLKKDFKTDTWRRFEEYLAAELDAAHIQLESNRIDAAATASLRGDIARIRKLQALGKPDPAAAPGSRRDGNQEDEEAF
jgi:hypothetical protein